MTELSTPNMSVKEAIKIAKFYGCCVKYKKRHSEIVFKHELIPTPYVISNNKNTINKGFFLG